jgi:hypothetical protein
MVDKIFHPNQKTKRINIENVGMKKYLVVSKLCNTYLYIYIHYHYYSF